MTGVVGEIKSGGGPGAWRCNPKRPGAAARPGGRPTRVTAAFGIGDDADSEQIVNLFQTALLAFQLAMQ
jgi:hypothetical protein